MTSPRDELFDWLTRYSPLLGELSESQLQQLVRHLELVLETNQQFNLTSITDPQEAVAKHIVDSLLPADEFAGARTILDVGSGPGYPGIPLAIRFPETKFVLAESTQKKARFLQTVVDDLKLPNVTVRAERAETILKGLPPTAIDLLTARAVGSIEKLFVVLSPVIRRFGRMVLYKGQRAGEEIAAAAEVAGNLKLDGKIIKTYELPDELGTHCLVEYFRGE